MTNCTTGKLRFSKLGRRELEADFSGGAVSSDEHVGGEEAKQLLYQNSSAALMAFKPASQCTRKLIVLLETCFSALFRPPAEPARARWQ